MNRERVVILAVTKMLSGMCTAGITHSENKWLRPVKEFGSLLLGDLMYKDKTVMRPFDIVEFALKKPLPRDPHIEDWVCDFVRERPERVGRLDEDRLIFLDRHVEPRVPQDLINAERSLGLIKPTHAKFYFHRDTYSGKYEARIYIPEMGERPIPVTDIKWRAMGRELLNAKPDFHADLDAMKQHLVVDHIFIALGLGRMHEGRHWPLVIGVHTWPDYYAEIDYKKL